MLTSIHHLLKNDGRVFLTVFFLDAAAMDGIENKRTPLSFKHRTPTGKLYAEKSEDPTFAVAYDSELVDELIGSASFQIERHVLVSARCSCRNGWKKNDSAKLRSRWSHEKKESPHFQTIFSTGLK